MRQYVGIILVKDDGSVLAQHRDDKPEILGPDTWCVTGGAREEDDKDLKTTACRELKEETDYILNPSDIHFLALDVYRTEKGREVQRTILWARYDGEQTIYTNEGQEIRFIRPAELNTLNFYTGHQNFLKRASEKVFNPRIENKG